MKAIKMGKTLFNTWLVEARALLQKLPSTAAGLETLSERQKRSLLSELEALIHGLDEICGHLDPIAKPDFVFDPTAPQVVAQLVADNLLLRPRHPLAAITSKRFYGAGVYALYYRGKFDCYRPISKLEHPIYVGKADPDKLEAATPKEQGERLSTRLRDHIRSIRGTSNLDPGDFYCRFLVVRSAWIETAEDLLISRFKPVWNKEIKVCQGFGKHGDDPNTRANKRSPWDTLHPGRKWATREDNTPGEQNVEQIKAAIRGHFAKYPPQQHRSTENEIVK